MIAARVIIICLILTGGADAQNTSELSILKHGDFVFKNNYQKDDETNFDINFHAQKKRNAPGDDIVYFIFKSNPDMFAFAKSIGVNKLFSTLEPCSPQSDFQGVGGDIKDVDNNTYIERLIGGDIRGSIFVPINRNLAKYSGYPPRRGFEWLERVAKDKMLCIRIGVGRMGYGHLTSRLINIGKIEEFEFNNISK